MPGKVFAELEGKRRKKEHIPGKVIKSNVGNTCSIFSEGGTGQREKLLFSGSALMQ